MPTITSTVLDGGHGACAPLPTLRICYRGDTLLGIESVNRAGDHMFGRRLLGAGGSITPEQARDMSFDLKSALA